MTEPMTSFAAWACACGKRQDVPATGQPLLTRWPVGWRIVTSETFARAVCPRCVDAKAKAR